MNTVRLLTILGKRFPKNIAKEYHDYVGLMSGKLHKETNRILLCLDYDDEVEEVALKYHPDLIITHHPFFYGKKKEILNTDSYKARLNANLEANEIPLYSMHTNFDAAKGGMNDALAKALDLDDIYAPFAEKMMRIGFLKEPMSVHEFTKYAKEKLGVKYGLLVANGNNIINKVGIIGGGGSSDYKVAMLESCDIYISGDVAHHTRREMLYNSFNYLDLPHEIERIFMPTLKNILLEIDSTLEIKIVDHEKEPEVI